MKNQDPESFCPWIADGKIQKMLTRDKHPGSATLEELDIVEIISIKTESTGTVISTPRDETVRYLKKKASPAGGGGPDP